MLGWFIIIARQDTGAPAGAKDAQPLATWETSLGGLDWIDALVAQGKATRQSAGGYPTRYVADAAAVLPMLLAQQVPPHRHFCLADGNHAASAGWVGEVHFHADRIALCSHDEPLIIDAWDQS